jgi:hypothetical protein
MTVAASIFLIAVGAILYFATNFHIAEINIDTVGLILMTAGLVGLVLGLILEASQWRRSHDAYLKPRRGPGPPY